MPGSLALTYATTTTDTLGMLSVLDALGVSQPIAILASSPSGEPPWLRFPSHFDPFVRSDREARKRRRRMRAFDTILADRPDAFAFRDVPGGCRRALVSARPVDPRLFRAAHAHIGASHVCIPFGRSPWRWGPTIAPTLTPSIRVEPRERRLRLIVSLLDQPVRRLPILLSKLGPALFDSGFVEVCFLVYGTARFLRDRLIVDDRGQVAIREFDPRTIDSVLREYDRFAVIDAGLPRIPWLETLALAVGHRVHILRNDPFSRFFVRDCLPTPRDWLFDYEDCEDFLVGVAKIRPPFDPDAKIAYDCRRDFVRLATDVFGA